jgi:hypothetical protein
LGEERACWGEVSQATEMDRGLAAGSWKLLEAPLGLLVALRDRTGGLLSDVSGLHPKGAVLAGDLAEMQPSDILNFLHQGRRTGVLLTRVADVERAIVLVGGDVAWACSTSAGERLGELLARMGLADRAQVEAVVRAQASAPGHRRIGQLLVDRGVLTQEALSKGLRQQLIEIFLGLLVAREGSFVFLRGVDPTALPMVLSLDTQSLLLDGLRRLDEMELYRTRVPSADVAPKKTGKAADGDLGAAETAVLDLVDGRRSLVDVAAQSALAEFEVAKATYKLIESGYLRL